MIHDIKFCMTTVREDEHNKFSKFDQAVYGEKERERERERKRERGCERERERERKREVSFILCK